MEIDDVEIVEKRTPFRGYFRIDKYKLRHRQFEGGWGPVVEREIFERGHAAACLPYDPVLDRVVLIEQFRPGAFAALDSHWFDGETQSPWLIEIIAGIIEPGESPENVIRREALEEAGCAVFELEPIAHYLVTPGGSSESLFAFCGRVDASKANGFHGLEHEGEDIRVFTVSADEAIALLDEGRIINSMTMIPLQWFRQNRERIREKWLAGSSPA